MPNGISRVLGEVEKKSFVALPGKEPQLANALKTVSWAEWRSPRATRKCSSCLPQLEKGPHAATMQCILYPPSHQGGPLPMGKNPLLMAVRTLRARFPCRQDYTLVQSLWKSVGRPLEKPKVTQKSHSWVETLENPLPVCPCVSPFSGVVSLILKPAINLRVCGQESGIYRLWNDRTVGCCTEVKRVGSAYTPRPRGFYFILLL